MDELERQKLLLFNEARLGLEMEDFLTTAVGKYLLHRATQVIEEARNTLESVPYTELEEVRKAQFDAAVSRMAMRWLQEAVTNGNQAVHELQQLESE